MGKQKEIMLGERGEAHLPLHMLKGRLLSLCRTSTYTLQRQPPEVQLDPHLQCNNNNYVDFGGLNSGGGFGKEGYGYGQLQQF